MYFYITFISGITCSQAIKCYKTCGDLGRGVREAGCGEDDLLKADNCTNCGVGTWTMTKNYIQTTWDQKVITLSFSIYDTVLL